MWTEQEYRAALRTADWAVRKANGNTTVLHNMLIALGLLIEERPSPEWRRGRGMKRNHIVHVDAGKSLCGVYSDSWGDQRPHYTACQSCLNAHRKVTGIR